MVRILPPQPGIQVLGTTSRKAQEKAGNSGFLRIRFSLQAPNSPILGRQLPKVSSRIREYSRFAETLARDLVRYALQGAPSSPFDRNLGPSIGVNGSF